MAIRSTARGNVEGGRPWVPAPADRASHGLGTRLLARLRAWASPQWMKSAPMVEVWSARSPARIWQVGLDPTTLALRISSSRDPSRSHPDPAGRSAAAAASRRNWSAPGW